jgi:hypothetical protein
VSRDFQLNIHFFDSVFISPNVLGVRDAQEEFNNKPEGQHHLREEKRTKITKEG